MEDGKEGEEAKVSERQETVQENVQVQAPYKLYAGEIQDVPKGVKYSFVPSHLQYLLLYSNVYPEPQENFVEIDETQVELTAEETTWLMQCKMAINAAHIQSHKEEYIDAFDAWLDVFEAELKKERTKQNRQQRKSQTKAKGEL